MRPTDRTRQAKADEKRFPVRVRVAIPEGGFITCGTDLYPWLDRHCGGRKGWAMHGSYDTTQPVGSAYLYVSDIAVAAEFLEAFNLEAVEVADDRPFPDRETLLHLHGIAGGNRTRRVKR